MQKTIWQNSLSLIIILFLLFISLRIYDVFSLATTEEAMYYTSLINKSSFYGFPHPPLAFWSFKSFSFIFGDYLFAYKLAPFFYSILIFFVVYKFCNRFFNYKTAFFALFFLTFNFGNIQSSHLLDTDSIILGFYSLLTIYALYNFNEKRSFTSKVFIGLSLGLSLLVKISAILLVPVILFTLISGRKLDKKDLIDIVKTQIIILVFATLVFSIFPIIDFIFNNGHNVYATVLRLVSSASTTQGNLITFIFYKTLKLFQSAAYISPFLLVLVLLWFLKRRMNTLSIHVFIQLIFFAVLFSPLQDISRYLLGLVPVLCILAGDYLSDIKFNKKDILPFFILGLIFLSLLTLSGLEKKELISFNEPGKIIEKIKNLDFNFYIPTWGAGGPKYLYLDFKSVFLSQLIAMSIFFFILLNYRKQNFIKLIFVMLIAYNLFFGLENAFYLTSPNIDKIKEQIIDYSIKNDLKEPIALSHPELGSYIYEKYNNTLPYAIDYLLLRKHRDFLTNKFLISKNSELVDEVIKSNKHLHFVRFDANWKTKDKFDFMKEKVIEPKGTIIYLDIPYGDKIGELWRLITQNCIIIKTFEDKGYILGYIFECQEPPVIDMVAGERQST